MRRVVFGIVLVFAIGSSVQAQTASPPPPTVQAATIDPDALAAAHELLVTIDIKTQMSNMMDVLIPIETAVIRKEKPNVNEETLSLFTTAFREEFGANLGNFENIYANMYAEHFTAAELRQLNAFYKTDVGQKVLHQLPVLMKEIQPLAINFGMEMAKQTRERVNVELQKKGQSL